MYTCIFCRHGEIENPQKIYYGRTIDLSLDERGKKTVQALGDTILQKKIPVTAIYTSPLRRARQTADILSHIVRVQVIVHDSLADVDIPALAGKPLTIRSELLNKGKDEYEGIWVWKGNESRRAIAQRMTHAFNEILDQTEEGVPVIVSHGDPLTLLLYALENPGKKLLAIGKLKKLGYGIEKGHGILASFDRNRKMVKKEIIT